MAKSAKKSARSYSTEFRQENYRRFIYEKLISTRVLEGLNFEDVEGKIAETLQISKSHARKIRKFFIDWGWARISPAKFEITQTAWDEFKEKE